MAADQQMLLKSEEQLIDESFITKARLDQTGMIQRSRWTEKSLASQAISEPNDLAICSWTPCKEKQLLSA